MPMLSGAKRRKIKVKKKGEKEALQKVWEARSAKMKMKMERGEG